MMMELGYLQRLTLQLTAGAAMLPDSIRDPHAKFVLSQQRIDGGWSGREGVAISIIRDLHCVP